MKNIFVLHINTAMSFHVNENAGSSLKNTKIKMNTYDGDNTF